ncbi:hypothetical protein PsYK624_045980 [Phanerochaete sordida]|uniref:Uncharacterized protein n=1 Tax=Phanerochaete sordida TaxID=48140 RepID=A0A9P3G6M7_9APHY|nr:hypothetical protein PsYK624_045980 [Phanerochaete sordida]
MALNAAQRCADHERVDSLLANHDVRQPPTSTFSTLSSCRPSTSLQLPPTPSASSQNYPSRRLYPRTRQVRACPAHRSQMSIWPSPRRLAIPGDTRGVCALNQVSTCCKLRSARSRRIAALATALWRSGTGKSFLSRPCRGRQPAERHCGDGVSEAAAAKTVKTYRTARNRHGRPTQGRALHEHGLPLAADNNVSGASRTRHWATHRRHGSHRRRARVAGRDMRELERTRSLTRGPAPTDSGQQDRAREGRGAHRAGERQRERGSGREAAGGREARILARREDDTGGMVVPTAAPATEGSQDLDVFIAASFVPHAIHASLLAVHPHQLVSTHAFSHCPAPLTHSPPWLSALLAVSKTASCPLNALATIKARTYSVKSSRA